MHYHLSFAKAQQQIVDITITVDVPAEGLELTLPCWRPGRYTRQDFAKHIADFRVLSEDREPLQWEKTDTNTWYVTPRVATRARIHYGCFANQQDAGGTYVDDSRILFNGITCLMYVEALLDKACELSLDLPADFRLGGAFSGTSVPYQFASVHQLLDTPFLAAQDLQHEEIDLQGVKAHVWLLGQHSLKVAQLKHEILTYSQTQLKMFGACPVGEYHYLYLFWAHPYRHGVEHETSTVIVMGPGQRMHQPSAHKSLLEISSHEFFHTWNVKSLRPTDMWPYDYRRENYSRLHYVTEGVTSYYGDLMLWKSGLWSWDQWIESINGELARHYGMAGKDFTSLSQASFDSWVNGYDTSGFPNRRISFYTKGYLVAMLTDHQIRQYSGGQHSLDDVICEMYHQIARAGRGYSAEDYQTTVERYARQDMTQFFAKYVEGVQPLDLELEDIAEAGGLKLWRMPPTSAALSLCGIEWKQAEGGQFVISNIWPDSPAEKVSVYQGDTLVALNGLQFGTNPDKRFEILSPGEACSLSVGHHGELRTVEMKANLTTIAVIPQLIPMIEASRDQRAYRDAWQRLGGADREVAQLSQQQES